MLKNIASKTGIRQFLLLTTLIILFLFTSCAGSQNAQGSRHRKPVSTGKRKCGCSMLIPDTNRNTKLYQQTYYVLQA
ncbi:MAG: hypothetical protein Q7U54_10760 [Bacteroidales bacterium]|nr:hypothetical protein [Bacteroidales bacterium]